MAEWRAPRTVVVGPHSYTIRTRKGFYTDHDLYGATWHPKLEIGMDADVALSQAQDTLLHECLHAVFEHSGLSHKMDSAKEEKFVRGLAPWILMMLRENPRLVEFLLK